MGRADESAHGGPSRGASAEQGLGAERLDLTLTALGSNDPNEIRGCAIQRVVDDHIVEEGVLLDLGTRLLKASPDGFFIIAPPSSKPALEFDEIGRKDEDGRCVRKLRSDLARP